MCSAAILTRQNSPNTPPACMGCFAPDEPVRPFDIFRVAQTSNIWPILLVYKWREFRRKHQNAVCFTDLYEPSRRPLGTRQNVALCSRSLYSYLKRENQTEIRAAENILLVKGKGKKGEKKKTTKLQATFPLWGREKCFRVLVPFYISCFTEAALLLLFFSDLECDINKRAHMCG